jgi:hypothetical protein
MNLSDWNKLGMTDRMALAKEFNVPRKGVVHVSGGKIVEDGYSMLAIEEIDEKKATSLLTKLNATEDDNTTTKEKEQDKAGDQSGDVPEEAPKAKKKPVRRNRKGKQDSE